VTVFAGPAGIRLYSADVMSVDGRLGNPAARVRPGSVAPAYDAETFASIARVMVAAAELAALVDELLALESETAEALEAQR
jgi:hypothetical protein